MMDKLLAFLHDKHPDKSKEINSIMEQVTATIIKTVKAVQHEMIDKINGISNVTVKGQFFHHTRWDFLVKASLI